MRARSRKKKEKKDEKEKDRQDLMCSYQPQTIPLIGDDSEMREIRGDHPQSTTCSTADDGEELHVSDFHSTFRDSQTFSY